MGKTGRIIKNQRQQIEELTDVINSYTTSEIKTYKIGTEAESIEMHLTDKELLELAIDILKQLKL